jgi:hypothetical protein
VLDVNFLKFNTSKLNRTAELKWQVDDSRNVANFIIEYSLDNTTFTPLASVPSNVEMGTTEYAYTHPLDNINADLIFYRIRAVGPSGAIKISNTTFVKMGTEMKRANVFPNPTQGETWVNMQSSDKTEADVSISDSYGRLIYNGKEKLVKGENQFALAKFMELLPGMYIVRVKSINGEIVQKVILDK